MNKFDLEVTVIPLCKPGVATISLGNYTGPEGNIQVVGTGAQALFLLQ
jgi:hypothetical protein